MCSSRRLAGDSVLASAMPRKLQPFPTDFARKVRTTRIIYGVSDQLYRFKQLVAGDAWSSASPRPTMPTLRGLDLAELGSHANERSPLREREGNLSCTGEHDAES